MAEDNTLTKALVDVRARRAALQGDYDRIAAELTKLRAAEAALTSIVEGVPLEETGHLRSTEAPRASAGDRAAPQQGGRRGARGPENTVRQILYRKFAVRLIRAVYPALQAGQVG